MMAPFLNALFICLLPEGGQGAGEAIDVDEEGRLVVRTDSGEVHVFTGEVSVHGIYGAV